MKIISREVLEKTGLFKVPGRYQNCTSANKDLTRTKKTPQTYLCSFCHRVTSLVGSRKAADILCFHSSKGFLTLLYEIFSDVSIRNDLYKPLVNLMAEHMGNRYSVQ